MDLRWRLFGYVLGFALALLLAAAAWVGLALREDVAEENRRLRRENAELRKANEVLKAASVFFAKELDQPRTR